MRIKNGISSICFLLVGLILFSVVQHVLEKKWFFPVDTPSVGDTFDEFYSVADSSDVQALFFGASHVIDGIDPMLIYEETGITTYNLGTSGQPVEVSRYALQDALQHTKPAYVFFDTSILFRDELRPARYRYVLDNMKNGPAKGGLAYVYANHFGGQHFLASFLSAFFPIYEYHERWKELTSWDFVINNNRNLYRKGHSIIPEIIPASIDVSMMNEISQAIEDKNNRESDAEKEGEPAGATREEDLDFGLSRENEDFILQMRALCDAAGAKFYMIEIPSIAYPQDYVGAWTRYKSDCIKRFSTHYDIPFLDLLYDYDLSIDWKKDTYDAGKHLNTMGAKKVSEFFAHFLKDECGLPSVQNSNFEADIPVYNRVFSFLELRSTQKLDAYLEAASRTEGICVFFSVAGDMTKSLTQEDMEALKRFGLNTAFSVMAYGDAYLAVVDENSVIYEETSNGQLKIEGSVGEDIDYSLRSDGRYSSMKANVVIEHDNYSLQKRGLNIVVLDKKSKVVVDSLCFDTNQPGEQLAIRDLSRPYVRDYGKWIETQDYK